MKITAFRVLTMTMPKARRIKRKPTKALNFKSHVSEVHSASDIQRLLGVALLRQGEFLKGTTPWDKSRWNAEQLDTFRIDPERTDRVYHINTVEE